MRLLVAALMLVSLGGCWTAGPPLPPSPSGPVADLTGTWRGTWAGAPVALLVINQTVDSGYGGFAIWDYQLAAARRPGFSGVLTSTIRGEAVSSRAQGWLGHDATGRLLLLVESDSPAGYQYLTLARVDSDRLAGSGESTFTWGPRGPAVLTRQAR